MTPVDPPVGPPVGPPVHPPVDPPRPAVAPPPSSVLDDLRQTWAVFARRPSTTLVPVVVGSIAQGIVLTVFYLVAIVGLLALVAGGAGAGTAVAAVVVYLVGFVGAGLVFQIVYAWWIRAGFAAVDNVQMTGRELYQGWSRGAVVRATLLIAAPTAVVVYLLDLVPGLRYLAVPVVGVIAYLCQFAVPLVVDRKLGAVEAVSTSARLARLHVRRVLPFDLCALVAFALGVVACGVGSWLATAVVLVGGAHLYRDVTMSGVDVTR